MSTCRNAKKKNKGRTCMQPRGKRKPLQLSDCYFLRKQSLSVMPSSPLSPGSEFHLSCSASNGAGQGRVRFDWAKEDGYRYRIDTRVAER